MSISFDRRAPAALLVVTSFLAACSGGGGGGDETPHATVPLDIPRAGQSLRLAEIIDPANGPFQTYAPDMPLTGTATMRGIYTVPMESTRAELVGDTTALLDFDAGTLDGTIGNLSRYEAVPLGTRGSLVTGDGPIGVTEIYDGTLRLDGAVTGARMNTDVTGTFTGQGDFGAGRGPVTGTVRHSGSGSVGERGGRMAAAAVTGGSVTLDTTAGTIVTDDTLGILYLEE